jgi:hypothetical protein
MINKESKMDDELNEELSNVETTEVENTDVETQESKPDLSKISQEDKITHSFKKQISRQKSKYEKLLEENNKKFSMLTEELEKLKNPDKYRPKARQDFETDDEYIDYLTESRVNNIMSKKEQEVLARQEEESKRARVYEEAKARSDENIKKHFKSDTEYNEYINTVSSAFEKGLDKLIDSDKDIAMYLISSEVGPKIVYELAKSPQKVKQLFGQKTSMARFFELKKLESDISGQSQPKNTLAKPLGRPGVNSEPTKDVFANDNDILRMLRGRK